MIPLMSIFSPHIMWRRRMRNYVEKLLTIQIPFFQSAASSGSLRRSRSPSFSSSIASISHRTSWCTLQTSRRNFRGCVARDFRNYMRTRSLGAPQLQRHALSQPKKQRVPMRASHHDENPVVADW